MQHALPPISERWLLALLCTVQFVHVVDFMMVLPLGPDFATGLGFPVHTIGYIAGAYAFAAAIAGLVAALYLDTFSRKRALLFCLAGTGITTILTAFVWDLPSMIAARLLAGAFGGPMMGICNAYVADYIPPERRGRAMGQLMGVFAIGSVIGVPIGLELAHYFGWQAPFFAIGSLALLVLVLGLYKLPYYKPFVEAGQSIAQRVSAIGRMLRNRWVLTSYACMAIGMTSAHLIIPTIAPFVQMNMGYPREDLGILYMVAGGVSFFTMRYAGLLVDKYSSTVGALLFASLFIINLYIGFVWAPMWLPVFIPFTMFMVALSGRGVSIQTLSSKVPAPQQRGAYMAIQSTIMQMAGAFASYMSAVIMAEQDGKLLHVDRLAWASIGLSFLIPLLTWHVEKHVKRRNVPPIPIGPAI